MRHYILIQTLLFLTRLPTRQDGVEKRDKVYLARNVLISAFFRGSKSIKNRYRFCTIWLVGLEEEIIDKDFTQSYWLALQFWVQLNRIFTVGVPQASHGITNKIIGILHMLWLVEGCAGLHERMQTESWRHKFYKHAVRTKFLLGFRAKKIEICSGMNSTTKIVTKIAKIM